MKKKTKVSKKKSAPKARKAHSVSATKTGYKLVKDNVLVRPLSPEELDSKVTSFGIVIPDTAKKRPDQGIVMAIGPGRFEHGTRIPLDVKVGDKVYFEKPWDEPITINGVEYFVMAEAKITLIQ